MGEANGTEDGVTGVAVDIATAAMGAYSVSVDVYGKAGGALRVLKARRDGTS